MKDLIKGVLKGLGLDVRRYKKPVAPKIIEKLEFLNLYDTVTGRYYLPNNAKEDIVANAIMSNKIFEKEVVDCAAKYIKRESAVLDVGSNFGQMSVLFSKMVGDTGRVYAFDADDFIFDILQKNLAANNCTNVISTFGAVHSKYGETLIFPKQDFVRFNTYGSYGIDYNATEGRKVKSITIDSLNIDMPVSLMKIDIQGGDLLALKGAVNTIKKNKMPILFEFEYHFQDEYKLSFQEYVEFVNEIDYKFERVMSGHNYLIIPR